MTSGPPTPWFASEGVGPIMIGIGEPRLRRSCREDSWSTRAGAFLGRLRPAAARVPALGR